MLNGCEILTSMGTLSLDHVFEACRFDWASNDVLQQHMI
jgi:hypothetical protein